MGENLIQLAERFIALNGEIELVHAAMKRLLLNGGDDKPKAPFVPPARALGGSQPQKMIAAQAAEDRIVELLRASPGLKTGQIAERTASKTNTAVERLKRLRAKGRVTRGDGREDGWSAAAPG